MRINAYLNFNGQCEEAFAFYAKVLGGQIVAMMPFDGTPAAGHVPPEWRKKIIHARMNVGEDVLMASDAPPGQFEPSKGFSVSVQVTDPAQAERIFHALADNGTVRMPIQQTFWAVRFGMLIDRYGIPWMINCEATPA